MSSLVATLCRLLFFNFIAVKCYLSNSPHIITFWGEDPALQGAGKVVKALNKTCSGKSSYSTVVLGFVNKSYQNKTTASLPPMHCIKSKKSKSKLSLYCPEVARKVDLCQRNKKKVLIGVGGPNETLYFDDAKSAQNFATKIWNWFLGGVEISEMRPFGGMTLDGVNLFLKDENSRHVDVFLRTLNKLRRGDPEDKYTYTMSVPCNSPELYFGEGRNKLSKEKIIPVIKQIYVRYSGKECCKYGPKHFRRELHEWKKFAAVPKRPELFVLFPRNPHKTMTNCFSSNRQLSILHNIMRLKNRLGGFITETKSASLRKASFLIRAKHEAVKQLQARSYKKVIKPSEIKLSRGTSHPMSNSVVFGSDAYISPKPLVGKQGSTPISSLLLLNKNIALFRDKLNGQDHPLVSETKHTFRNELGETINSSQPHRSKIKIKFNIMLTVDKNTANKTTKEKDGGMHVAENKAAEKQSKADLNTHEILLNDFMESPVQHGHPLKKGKSTPHVGTMNNHTSAEGNNIHLGNETYGNSEQVESNGNSESAGHMETGKSSENIGHINNDTSAENNFHMNNQTSGNNDQLENQTSATTDQIENQSSDTADQIENQSSGTTDQIENQSSDPNDQIENQSSGTTDQIENQSSDPNDQIENQSSDPNDQIENQSSGTNDQIENQRSGTADQIESQNSDTNDQIENQTSATDDQIENQSSGSTDQIDNGNSAENNAQIGNETSVENNDQISNQLFSANDNPLDNNAQIPEEEVNVNDALSTERYHFDDSAEKHIPINEMLVKHLTYRNNAAVVRKLKCQREELCHRKYKIYPGKHGHQKLEEDVNDRSKHGNNQPPQNMKGDVKETFNATNIKYSSDLLTNKGKKNLENKTNSSKPILSLHKSSKAEATLHISENSDKKTKPPSTASELDDMDIEISKIYKLPKTPSFIQAINNRSLEIHQKDTQPPLPQSIDDIDIEVETYKKRSSNHTLHHRHHVHNPKTFLNNTHARINPADDDIDMEVVMVPLNN